jgi:hypothetical protein
MLDIRYRRTQPTEPEVIDAYGQTFKEGEFVSVSDKFAEKARGNPSFEVKGEKTFGDQPPKKPEASTEEAEARERAETAKAAAEETRRAKQAEARGGSSKEDRA